MYSLVRTLTRSTVRLNDGSRCQLKFQPTCFLPCRLHLSNSPHEVEMVLTCQLGNLERRHGLNLTYAKVYVFFYIFRKKITLNVPQKV